MSFPAARIEVDLSRLRGNVSRLVDIVWPATVIAVVKSDAYGHGLVQAARAFIDGGAANLAVSTVGEGVELRRHGLDCPVMTLVEPARQEIRRAIDFNIGVSVCSQDRIREVSDVEEKQTSRVAVHVKVDTGSGRAGCSTESLAEIVKLVSSFPKLHLASIWSEFAGASDNFATDTSTYAFSKFQEAIETAGVPRGTALHIANSAASISMPASRLDTVRSGIALYGYSGQIDQTVARQLGFAPALTLVAPVRSIRLIRSGEWAGYGQPRQLKSDSLLANVGVGYAHGLPRSWGLSGGWVAIRGHRYEILGPVSMEQMVVNIGDPSTSQIATGDEVIIMGDGSLAPSAADIANGSGSIPNEVLCRIGLSRLRRIFLDGANSK